MDINKMPEPGASPIINLKEPQTVKYPNGLVLMVVENHKLPIVSLRLLMDVGPSDQKDMVGIGEITSKLMGNGTKNISKDAYNEEVEFLGANISLTAKGGSASSLKRYFPRVMELFADAAFHPKFDQEELEKQKAIAIEELKSGDNSAEGVSSRVTNALVYTIAHPYGRYSTEESLKKITTASIETYYKENFLPNKAYMVIQGDITMKEAKAMVDKYFKNWKKGAKVVSAKIPTPVDVDKTQVNFVDMPNAVQCELSVFNLEDLKMNDADYFPVLVMNYILGGGFGSYINYNLREEKAFTYGAWSYIDADKWTRGTFVVNTKLRNEVAAPAVGEIYKEIKRIQTTDVDANKLAEAKASYLGDFIMSTEKASSVANFALNIATRNLSKDFYKNYIKSIENVTVQDIRRVANKYLKLNNLRFVVVGKKAECEKGFNELKLDGKNVPVYYFDKYAKEVK